MKEQDRQNINPTPAAVIAMVMYREEYAAQRGGSMDFWRSLAPYKRRICQETADRVIEAHRNHR